MLTVQQISNLTGCTLYIELPEFCGVARKINQIVFTPSLESPGLIKKQHFGGNVVHSSKNFAFKLLVRNSSLYPVAL
jgi:hypothetical protein